ncbi:hypothetical protein BGW80DRAFT_1401491, partial [Lactifluus volemus]
MVIRGGFPQNSRTATVSKYGTRGQEPTGGGPSSQYRSPLDVSLSTSPKSRMATISIRGRSSESAREHG